MKYVPLMIITFIGSAVLMLQWGRHRELKAQIKSEQDTEAPQAAIRQTRDLRAIDRSSKQADLMAGLTQYLKSSPDDLGKVWPNDLVEIVLGATSEDLKALIA